MSETLLQQAQSGDADAFTALCAPYEGLVYRHCLQMLGNPADAQDAAQEAMLRAYRGLARFRGGSAVATWLYRIAHNVCLDMRKRGYRRMESTSLDGMAEAGREPADAAPNPEARYVQTGEQERLRAALTRLPREQQLMLGLRYGEGMPYDQLAATLRLSLGTVKSKLSRAKEKLRKILEDG